MVSIFFFPFFFLFLFLNLSSYSFLEWGGGKSCFGLGLWDDEMEADRLSV